MESTLVKRLKSFLWRASGMAVVAFFSFVTGNLTELGLSTAVTATLGLVLGEFTKWLNSYLTKNSI